MALVTYRGTRTETSFQGIQFDLNVSVEIDDPAILKRLTGNPCFDVEEGGEEDADDTWKPTDELRERAKAAGVRLRKTDTEESLLARIEKAEADAEADDDNGDG